MSSLMSTRVRSLLKSPSYQPRAPSRTLSRIGFLSSFSARQPIFASRHNTVEQPGIKKRLQEDSPLQVYSPARLFSCTSPTIVIEDSKRTPWLPFAYNEADIIERNMQDDGFRCWGITIYRTTYKSDSDWEEFLRRFLGRVRKTLAYYDGLDMWDSFRPTVMEDKNRFDGATPALIRDAFKEWAVTACETEQGVTYERAEWAFTARYRLCIMVDEEALRSVLDIPVEELNKYNDTGFVVLINGRWVPEMDPCELVEGEEDDEYEPLYGCTMEDVGRMKVRYSRAQIVASSTMRNGSDWDLEYRRPPAICFHS
ncbi:hypothetical protein BDW75DRAFT_226611 [Aspergillus navahoensis]